MMSLSWPQNSSAYKTLFESNLFVYQYTTGFQLLFRVIFVILKAEIAKKAALVAVFNGHAIA